MNSEFELIEKIKIKASNINKTKSSFSTGIGDDCAVLPKNSKTNLVITADLLIEDIDFRLKWSKPELIGHKALAVSLSDIAAMGAKPVWAMLSIGIPEKVWKTDFVEKFYEGWLNLAEKYNVELIGGDVSKTPDLIVIDSIAAGETTKGKEVLRSGAKPGDLIYITGNLGGAAFGLSLLESENMPENYEKPEFQKLLLRQLAPNPQSEIGRVIGEKNLATAMIDLSDGLSSDLAHLCRASGVGAKIFSEKIPIDENIKKFSNQKHRKAESVDLKNELSEELNLALNGGEDFELLFTVNPKKKFDLEKALKDYKFSAIGEVTANEETIELIANENSQILQPRGFRHF
jgi:thiamine-monophosphate kinase